MSSLEFWSFWTNIAVVSFTIAAAIAAPFALYFSQRALAAKDRDLARVQAESSNLIAAANARRAKANEQAATADERAHQLDIEAAEQRELVTMAERRAAAADQRAAQATERAANVEKELLELQTRLAPRTLTLAQHQIIVAKLRPFAGTRLNLLATSEDAEIIDIANRLLAALKDSNWRYGTFIGTDTTRTVSGIAIDVSPDADAPTLSAARALASALGAERLIVVGPVIRTDHVSGTFAGNPVPDAKITLRIGSR